MMDVVVLLKWLTYFMVFCIAVCIPIMWRRVDFPDPEGVDANCNGLDDQ